MSKTKKRTINELRQVKEYYTPPVSHKIAKAKNQKVKFTKKELASFLEGAIAHFLQADPEQCRGLKEDCKNYVQVYFNS
tara:strand:+ start:400 stop:636 length:237 start_codon:yes stop_codon:yes gene_type:complete